MKKRDTKLKLTLKKIAIIGFCLYALGTFIQQQFTLNELKTEKTKKQAQLVEIEKESKVIQNKIDNKDEIEYIEKMARDELDMVRPNEIIYEDKNRASHN